MNENTCADVVVDALHRNGGIGYSTTLGIPHNAFDPTMHLQAISMEHLWILRHRLINCLLHDVISCGAVSDFQTDEVFSSPYDQREGNGKSGPLETFNDEMMLFLLSRVECFLVFVLIN